MARLLGPDENTRLVYTIQSGYLRSAANQTAVVYSDAAGTILANILTEAGAAIPSSSLTVDSTSRVPIFQFPDGVDLVYMRVNGGAVQNVYARTDDRLDDLGTRLVALEAGGSNDLLLVHRAGTETITGAKTFSATTVFSSNATVAGRFSVGSGLQAEGLRVTNDGVANTLRLSPSAVGTATNAVVHIDIPDATKRAIDIRVPGDSATRIRLDTSASGGNGSLILGDGTSADAVLYRGGTATLRTDGSMIVQARLTAGNSTLSSSPLAAFGDGTNSVVLIQATAAGTATTATLAVITPAAVSKRAFDWRENGDSVSRIRFDTSAGSGSGTISIGNGALVDVNLYRGGTNLLQSDDDFKALTHQVVAGNSIAGANAGIDGFNNLLRLYSNQANSTIQVVSGGNFPLEFWTFGTKRMEISGTGGFGFFGATPVAQPTVTGSKGANAALTSLLTALASLGLVVDSSS